MGPSELLDQHERRLQALGRTERRDEGLTIGVHEHHIGRRVGTAAPTGRRARAGGLRPHRRRGRVREGSKPVTASLCSTRRQSSRRLLTGLTALEWGARVRVPAAPLPTTLASCRSGSDISGFRDESCGHRGRGAHGRSSGLRLPSTADRSGTCGGSFATRCIRR